MAHFHPTQPILGALARHGERDVQYSTDGEFMLPNFRGTSRASFTYDGEDVILDRQSPTTNLCCGSNVQFRIYRGEGPGRFPRGVRCVKCDTEYLNRNDYDAETVYNTESIRVHAGGAIEVRSSGKTEVFHRKIPPRLRFPPCSSILTMVNPSRRLIKHKDSAEIERLQPGTHVMWHRPYTLWHHLLIQRNNRGGKCDVIHFTTHTSGSCRKAIVKKETDYDFTTENNGTAYEIVYEEAVERSNPIELVIDRATSQEGDHEYSLCKNNCEHMVTFCKTGIRQSLQVHWLFWKILLLILRLIILSVAIYVVIKWDIHSKGSVSDNEEVVELLIVFGTELLMFFTVAVYWCELKRRDLVGFTDCWRRIGEALVELLLTVLAYMLHILVFISMPGTNHKTAHIGIGVVLGIFGKVLGCFGGQAFVQCVCTPVSSLGTAHNGHDKRNEYVALVHT